MRDLNKDAEDFDELFPRYSSEPYEEIKALVDNFSKLNAYKLIEERSFSEFMKLMAPIISIKNYKSQTPFPLNLDELVVIFSKIKEAKPSKDNSLSNGMANLFYELLNQKGFQLPTISAVFHFCHPENFPIVDVNIEAACKVLKNENSKCLNKIELPILPSYNKSPEDKLNAYNLFIKFINKVIDIQNKKYKTVQNYRSVDKALMVIGSKSLNEAKKKIKIADYK